MKCKDIANEYNVTPMQVGRLRKKFFPDHKGGELSEDEITVLVEYYESLEDLSTRKVMEEAVKPKFVDGFVDYVQAGRREVSCRIRNGDSIEQVFALIPTSTDPTYILHTTIPLEVIEHDNKKYYRHKSLSNIAWPKGYGSDE